MNSDVFGVNGESTGQQELVTMMEAFRNELRGSRRKLNSGKGKALKKLARKNKKLKQRNRLLAERQSARPSWMVETFARSVPNLVDLAAAFVRKR